MAWLYVPESVVSTLESPECCLNIELCVTSSAKPSQRPLSWRGWRTRPWMMLLFGTISRPSMANRGVERWISSLAGTRANLSVTRGSVLEKTIPGICGPTCEGSCPRCNPSTASSKTSAVIYDSASIASFPTFQEWATALRAVCLQRRKLAHPTDESGSSSWPTVTTNAATGQDYTRDGGKKGQERLSLSGGAKNWPKPSTMEDASVNMKSSQMNGTRKSVTLGRLVSNWATPTADPQPCEGTSRALRRAVESGVLTLGEATGMNNGKDPFKAQGNLPASVWPTPNARDGKGAVANATHREDGKDRRNDQLPNAVSFRPGLTTSKAGEDSSPNTRRLNPVFVEMLMGFTPGYTIPIESIDSGCWEMLLSRIKQRMRSGSCGR